jgi:solute:Na+ symporter, SSS family
MFFVVFSFLAFTGLVYFFTWWYVRGDKATDAENYFMAGRNLPWQLVSGSLLLTNLSAIHLVSMNGTSYKEGIVVAGWETLAALACALMACYFAPIYLGLKITTSPEYLEKRFDGIVRLFATMFFMIDYTVQDLPGAMYSGAVAFNQIFKVQESLGWEGTWGKFGVLSILVWVTGIMGGVIAIVGGLKAVAISDTLNGVGMFFAGLAVPVIGLSYIGDGNVAQGAKTLYETNCDKFNMAGGEGTSIPFEANFTGMCVSQIYYWCFSQAMIQRVFAARNLSHAQSGVIVTGLAKVLVPLIVVLPGIIAYHVLAEERLAEDFHADEAYPRLLAKIIPNWAMGIYAAVLAGAVLSTFNSNLNSIATMITYDIYKKWFDRDASEEKMIRVGTFAQIVLGVVAMLIAPFYVFAPAAYKFMQSISPFWTCGGFAIFMVGMIEFSFKVHIPIPSSGFRSRYLSFDINVNGHSVSPLAAKICYLVCPIFYFILFTRTEIHFLHSQGIVALFGIIFLHLHGYLYPLSDGEVHVMLKRLKKRAPARGNIELISAQNTGLPNGTSPEDSVKEVDKGDEAEASYRRPWPFVYAGAAAISVFALSLYFVFHATPKPIESHAQNGTVFACL